MNGFGTRLGVASVAVVLAGCAPLWLRAGQEPTRDYSVLTAYGRAPAGVTLAPGEPAELASGHLVSVGDVRSAEAPPAGSRWLHQPLGDVLVVELRFAEGQATNRLLVAPDVLVPLPDGRHLRADLCVADDTVPDPFETGLVVCVDVPPALSAAIDEVHLVDRSADDLDGATPDDDLPRWRIEVH